MRFVETPILTREFTELLRMMNIEESNSRFSFGRSKVRSSGKKAEAASGVGWLIYFWDKGDATINMLFVYPKSERRTSRRAISESWPSCKRGTEVKKKDYDKLYLERKAGWTDQARQAETFASVSSGLRTSRPFEKNSVSLSLPR